MQTILNAPVTTVQLEQALRTRDRCGQTGDAVDDFGLNLAGHA